MPELLAKDIMTENVITIKHDASIKELSELLLEKKISGVPVIDEEGKLIGIASEGDVIVQDTELHSPRYFKILDAIIYLESLNKFKERLMKHLAVKVSEIMTKKVITASAQTRVDEIAEIMVNEKINRVPVVSEDGRPIGIITRADILKSIVKN